MIDLGIIQVSVFEWLIELFTQLIRFNETSALVIGGAKLDKLTAHIA